MLRWCTIVLVAVLCTGMSGDPLKQGLVDLLMEFMNARYPDRPQADDLLYVSVQRQQLIHVNRGRSVGIYPISTAKAGLGGDQDSFRTPTGLHRVSEKIGADVPAFGILKDREFTGAMADPDFAGVDKDWITSRVLWLEGLEPGVNQGNNCRQPRTVHLHPWYGQRAHHRHSQLYGLRPDAQCGCHRVVRQHSSGHAGGDPRQLRPTPAVTSHIHGCCFTPSRSLPRPVAGCRRLCLVVAVQGFGSGRVDPRALCTGTRGSGTPDR